MFYEASTLHLHKGKSSSVAVSKIYVLVAWLMNCGVCMERLKLSYNIRISAYVVQAVHKGVRVVWPQ